MHAFMIVALGPICWNVSTVFQIVLIVDNQLKKKTLFVARTVVINMLFTVEKFLLVSKKNLASATTVIALAVRKPQQMNIQMASTRS